MSEQTKQAPAPPSSPDERQQQEEHHFQHEADRTELEKWLKQGYSRIGKYANYLAIGAIGLVVVLLAGFVWSVSSQSSRTAEWNQFLDDKTPEDLLVLADQRPDAPIGSWALLQAGRSFLAEGVQSALTNREMSDARLDQAVKAFDKLLKRRNVPPKAREQALYGLGTAREILNGGDPTGAIEAYQRLVDDFPNSQYAAWSKQRIETLQQESTTEFYAWFRQQNPSPSDRPLPRDGAGQTLPQSPLGNLDLLNDSDLKLPPSGVGEANPNVVPPVDADAPSDKTPDAKPAPAFPAPDAAPEETPKPEDAPKPEATNEADETPKSDDAPKPDAAPPTSEATNDAPSANSDQE